MLRKSFIALLSLNVLASQLRAEPAPTPAAGQQPNVSMTNGRITQGAKSIWHKEAYGQLTLCVDNDAIGQVFEMFNLGKSDIAPVFFMNGKTETAGNSVVFSADARDSTSSDKLLGKFRLKLALQDDGKVKVDSTCTLDDPALMKSRYSVLDLPSYLKITGQYTKAGKTVTFDDKSSTTFDSVELEGATITLFPDAPEKSIVIQPVSCSQIRIEGSRMTFLPKGETMSLLLDLSTASTADDGQAKELSPNGIDHWSVDRLHLPDYGASANLVQNPSFEAGLRYWGFPNYVHSLVPLKYTNLYELDDKVAHSGTSSLRVKALPMRPPSSMGTMPIPYVPGETYTYSFYARSSAGKPAKVYLWGRTTTQPQVFADNVKSFDVGPEWARYSVSFPAPERFAAIYMDVQSTDGSDDGHVWIDDVQLEKGELSAFAQPPVAAQLLSSARGNFLKFGQQPEFKLVVRTTPNASGTAAVMVEDFFLKTFHEKRYPFTTDAAGQATIELADLSERVPSSSVRGVLSVAATFTVDGIARPYRDYFRFSVMDFLENKHKNKNLFNLTTVYSHQAGGPHFERALARERAVGFGSICYDLLSFGGDIDYKEDEERVKLAEQYGFTYVGRPVLKSHDGEGGEISEEQGRIKMINIKNRINPTDAELAEFEAICELKARRRPWNKIWWFTGESNPGAMPLEAHADAFAKFLLATCRGVKKGNPDAKVLIEGGPWTMDPNYGAKWVERYIQDTRRIDPTVKFDAAAVHHYRNFPENPDLDADTAAFLAMLDRNGCADWPLYINEGGNFAPFNIPQEGMSPYIQHSSNAWHMGPLSYHYGRAERIAAAFSARNWLIGLKYADRVACMQDFNSPNRYVDYDFTSRPFEKIPNTLGRLLGDASFYKDVRFASMVRCYVFKDDKTGTPIAAIWGHKESVDRWKEDAPAYAFKFGPESPRFVDLMENAVTFPTDESGRTLIPMSPFPLFIVGKPGAEDALCEAIAAGAPVGDAGGAAVTVSAYPAADGQVTTVFKNAVGKPFTGNATVTLNGVERTVPLELPGTSSRELTTGLPRSTVKPGMPTPFKFTASGSGIDAVNVDGSFMFLEPGDAEPSDKESTAQRWNDVPAIDLGAGVSARIRLSGNDLKIAIECTDPATLAEDAFVGTGLFVDPFGTTDGWTRLRNVNDDLAVFEIVKSASGKLEAFCHFVQGTQSGSGGKLLAQQVQPAIGVQVDRTADRATMYVTVPREVLAPLTLEPGSRFALNLAIPTKSSGTRFLAPIGRYKDVATAGDIQLVTAVLDGRNATADFNGAFDGPVAGFWDKIGDAPGWASIDRARTYTTATGFIQIPVGVSVSSTTGMQAKANAIYSLQADLGGDAEGTAVAKLVATEHADGSGKRVELAQVTRKGTGGYELVKTTATSKPVPQVLAGYHLRVELSSSRTGQSYFDNVSVVSQSR